MEHAPVLVVDDVVERLTWLRHSRTRAGEVVNTASSADIALPLLADHECDVVLTELRLRGMDDVALVRELHAPRAETPVILMTAFGGLDLAGAAIKASAYHFVANPVQRPALGALGRKALTAQDLRRENRQLRPAVEERYRFGQLCGKSAALQRLFALLERLAATSRTGLMQGDSGPGKEWGGRALHYHGPRQPAPFVPVNWAALPAGLLESALFGHTKGAFSGAHLARRGRFLAAARGPLFLDDIGAMPEGRQAKLLMPGPAMSGSSPLLWSVRCS
jgi:two-component system response regulator HydG